MKPYIKALLAILNDDRYVIYLEDGPLNVLTDVREIVAKEFGFILKDGEWVVKSEPRFIEALGMKATDVFKDFITRYDYNYRVDLAVSEFYKLTDDEIIEMMEELVYFNKSFIDHKKFKPTAANFLKGKIWQTDYPRKINRDRSRKKTIHEITTWNEYKAILPKENIDTIESYEARGMNFLDFKKLIQGAGEKK